MLQVAEKHKILRIALVLLSSEIFGFTAEKGSSKIAWRAVNDYLAEHPDAFELVRFVSLKRSEPYKALVECMAD